MNSFKAILGFLFTAALSANAQVVFDIKATATQVFSTGTYSVGQEYAFRFATGVRYSSSDFVSGGPDATPTNPSLWQQVSYWGPTEKPLWSFVGGSGLIGGFGETHGTAYINVTESTDSMGNPPIYEHVDNKLSLMSFPQGYRVGLNPLWQIWFDAYFTASHFEQPTSYVDPVAYFANYEGTHPINPASPVFGHPSELTVGVLEGEVQRNNLFRITEISIQSTTAVPEPSTYALLSGLGLVAFAGWRRMKAQQA